jgi:hypothetical protein
MDKRESGIKTLTIINETISFIAVSQNGIE